MTQEDMALADDMLDRLLSLGGVELPPSQVRAAPPSPEPRVEGLWF